MVLLVSTQSLGGKAEIHLLWTLTWHHVLAVVTGREFTLGSQKATENCSVPLLPLLSHAPECPDPEEPQGT